MFKVIVERPRRPNPTKEEHRKYRIIGDAENLPKQESINKKYETDWGERLNENLAPLKRFLLSRVGKPWNMVWSEICKGLSPDSAVKKHVRDHAIQYVKTDIRMIDDIPYYLSKYSNSGWRPLTGTIKYPQLYMHPDTGILERAPEEKSFRSIMKEHKRSKALYTCNDGSVIKCLKGIWYNVKIEKYIVQERSYDFNRKDPITGLYVSKLVFVTKTRKIITQLNKKYLKTFRKWQKTGIWGNGKKKKDRRYFRKTF